MPVFWDLAGIGDLNGDGSSDVVLVASDGLTYYALTDQTGLSFNASAAPGKIPDPWLVIGIGDYSGNHRNDLLIQKATGLGAGQPWVFETGAGGLSWLSGENGSGAPFAGVVPAGWEIGGISDYNSNPNLASTLLVQQGAGARGIYIFANADFVPGDTGFYGTVLPNWSLPIFQGK